MVINDNVLRTLSCRAMVTNFRTKRRILTQICYLREIDCDMVINDNVLRTLSCRAMVTNFRTKRRILTQICYLREIDCDMVINDNVLRTLSCRAMVTNFRTKRRILTQICYLREIGCDMVINDNVLRTLSCRANMSAFWRLVSGNWPEFDTLINDIDANVDLLTEFEYGFHALDTDFESHSSPLTRLMDRLKELKHDIYNNFPKKCLDLQKKYLIIIL
jgi:ribosomal protein S6